jgi:hypothetical protein
LLRAADGLPTKAHATSGSSGVPVQFFVSDVNGNYNAIRSLAQFFLEGLDLSLNRTRLTSADAVINDSISVEKNASWISGLGSLMKSGDNKEIKYFTVTRKECRKLVQELTKDDIGYLVANPRIIDVLSSVFDLDFLKRANTAMWIPLSAKVDARHIETFAKLTIPVRANYSAEEVGMIGAECSKFSGYYHVATSNVIVEVVDRRFGIDGINLGKVLVTHLHSYATPFIRYDLGDLACLQARCPCGLDGPAIYNLEGRESRVLKHRDGRLSPFKIHTKALAALLDFTEYRIRQIAFDKIVVEFGGRSKINTDELAAVTTFLQKYTGPEFNIEIKACEEIDWGQSRKRPAFRCEV